MPRHSGGTATEAHKVRATPRTSDALEPEPRYELRTMGLIVESWPAQDILRWASERFSSRLTFATGFGAEGCVMIDLIARLQLPVDVFTLDTGLLFPETYDLWARLERTYGVTIRAVQPAQSVPEQARLHGDRLWEREPARCCALRKVAPLQGALKGFDAWLTAIRRDQTLARANARGVEWDERFHLVKVNPLVRWSKPDVWQYIQTHNVPYNALHDSGYPSIGCQPCTTRVGLDEDERAGRWRGQQKTECGLHASDDAGRAPRSQADTLPELARGDMSPLDARPAAPIPADAVHADAAHADAPQPEVTT